MTYKPPWRVRLDDRLDRFRSWGEKVWLCDLHNRHHIKMGSAPFCYRCGRRPS
jgi:hypothetical protein